MNYTGEVVKTLQIPAKYNYNKTIEGSIFFGLILSLLHIVIESRQNPNFLKNIIRLILFKPLNPFLRPC
jgi:hypothetical protein